MDEPILIQLQQLRQLNAEVGESIDQPTAERYAWLIVKVLNANIQQFPSVECRQLLADYLKLPLPHPSRLHSAILSVAIRIASAYTDFRFLPFLRMWGIENLRSEDYERQKAADGKTYPSLSDKLARAIIHAALLRPADYENSAETEKLLQSYGLTSPVPMIVTAIKEAKGKDNRKYYFVSLASADGTQAECESHALVPNPLYPLPEGKRHFVNVGQMYNVALRQKADGKVEIHEAMLLQSLPQDIFPVEIGYVEAIDTSHAHFHIFDSQSRHFVAPVLRFSRQKAGDFIRFIPVVPKDSKFKSAIILSTVPAASQEVKSILRDIRITSVNPDKGYASWELIDATRPIIETLSPLQLSLGEQSPSFTQGFINLPSLTDGIISSITPGKTLHALIYLRRGKDEQKRPRVAVILD